jgi:succinoglycan biosynthesis transport protein ExoP
MSELSKFSNFGGTERYRQKYVSYYTDEIPKKQEPAETTA